MYALAFGFALLIIGASVCFVLSFFSPLREEKRNQYHWTVEDQHQRH
jgi:hypothetical protein